MSRFSSNRAALAVCALCLLPLSGCGGGSPPAKSASPTGRAVISVQWPQRETSRLIPAASGSLQVSFLAGTTVLRTALLTRQSSTASQTQTEVDLPVGSLTVQAQAFPNADGSGNAQAGAQVPVTIRAGERTPVALTMASAISRVAITPDEIPFSVDPVPITAVAYDAQNRVVVTASWQWSVPSDGIVELIPSGAIATIQARKEGATTITLRETESGKTTQKPLIVTPPG